MKRHSALLSLGSNLGDRIYHLDEALRRLAALGELEEISGLYETEPVGYSDQGDFLNLAVSLRTHLSAADLLTQLLDIERHFGRDRKKKWGPRTIDIDIILYDDLILNGPDLTIPHPHYHQRRFVLAPLSEIAPGRVCPVRKVTLQHLMDRCEDTHRVRRWSGRPVYH